MGFMDIMSKGLDMLSKAGNKMQDYYDEADRYDDRRLLRELSCACGPRKAVLFKCAKERGLVDSE